MTRRLAAIDRVVTALVGIALVVGAAALLNWRFDWIGSWPGTLDTGRADDVVTSTWWPWAFAAGGIVVGLVGLAWLLSHAPRRGERAVRLSGASDRTGAIRIDLDSVAQAVAADFEARTSITRVKGSARRHGDTHVIELRGQVDPHHVTGVGSEVEAAARRCAQNVSDAFPDGSTVCRVLLGHDRRRTGRSRAGTPRVH